MKREEIKMKKYLVVLKMVVVVTGFVLGMVSTGIAAIPERYNINLVYSGLDQVIVPEDLKADAGFRKAVIYVAEFVDARPVADKKIVGHVREIGDAKVPVYLKNDLPARVIANGVKDYLKKAGYNVADKIVPWDLKEDTLPKKGPKIVIGGSLDEMNVSCWTGVFSNDYKAGLKITLVVADAAGRKIAYKGNVSVETTKTDVSYSEGQLGHQADTALAEAIQKLFEGKNIAQKIKQALAQ